MTRKPLLILTLLFSAACSPVFSTAQNASPKHTEFSAPAHSATSASVNLSASPEDVTIEPNETGNYFDAEIDYIGTLDYDASGQNESYSVSLREDANNLSYSGDPLLWDVRIDPATPLDLAVRSSSGRLSLNLNDFTLNGLRAVTSSGEMVLNLPATEQQYDAEIESSSGTVSVTLEDNARIDFGRLNSSSGSMTLNTGNDSKVAAAVESSSGIFTLNGGNDLELTGRVATSSGGINLHFEPESEIALSLSTSSGDITLDVPEGAALKLEVLDNSSGSVSVPDWLARVSGTDKTGVWETEGFAQSERQIVITVERNSSGAISVG